MNDFDRFNEVLRADFAAGKLYWKPRPRKMFKSERDWKIWNTRYAGEEAFTAQDHLGYRRGSFGGKKYLAHRVLWLLHHGDWTGEVDHINKNPSDNSLENLRCVTRSENQANRSPYGASRYLGIYRARGKGRWVAQFEGGHIGTFNCETSAHVARQKALANA